MTNIKIVMIDVNTNEKRTVEVPATRISKTLYKAKRRGIGVQVIDSMTGCTLRTLADEEAYLEKLPETMWRWVDWLRTHQAEYNQMCKDFETLVATESMMEDEDEA